MKNETLETKIEEIRNLANKDLPDPDGYIYIDGESYKVSYEYTDIIETAKKAILIIDELQKKLNEMTTCRDNALEQPFKLAQDIVKLRDEIENITKRLEIKKYISC